MLQPTYNPFLVVSSFVVAVLASYTALCMTPRMRTSHDRIRVKWLVGAALAQGIGIWGMHFTGLLAFNLPVPIAYDVRLVGLSIAISCVGALMALVLASRPQLESSFLVAGGLAIGVAIAGLHYMLTEAMRLAATVDHQSALVALSIVVACGCGIGGLASARRHRTDDSGRSGWRLAVAGLVLGIALAAHHYTAMAGTSFLPSPPQSIDPSSVVISAPALPGVVVVVTLGILALALLSARHDRRTRERVTLSQRFLGAEESERRRIGQLVDEDLGQLLAELRTNLQRLSSAGVPGAATAENIELLDEALERVRALSVELRPAILDQLGLSAAVAWYAKRQAERAGYRVVIDDTLTPTRLPAEIETASFRIFEQALANIERHAEARTVHIVLRKKADRFELWVTDDGVGFDVAQARARARAGGSLGLLHMAELATLADGQLTVVSSPGRSSTVISSFRINSK